MPASPPDTAHRRRLHVEWMTLWLVLALLAAIFSVTLFQDRQNIDAQERDRLQVQARVIDANIVRQLQGAGLALDGVKSELATKDGALEIPATSTKLKLLSGAMPGVNAMLLLDAGGTVTAASRPDLVGKNFKERDYFAVPRATLSASTLYASPPFRSVVGNYVVILSRSLTDVSGRFSGVIAASLDADYFNVVLSSVLYAPDMQSALVHGEGQVFLSLPPDPQATDANRGKPAPWLAGAMAAMAANEPSPSTATSGTFTTHDDRLVAIRRLDGAALHMSRPMVVAVSRELASLYAPWRNDVYQFGVLFLVIALGSVAALHFSQRRRQTLRHIAVLATQERQRAAERLDLALSGANLGLWDLHVPTGHVVVNARELALFGFSESDAPENGAGWRKLVHPEDRAIVDAAIQPHLQGSTSAYECVYRMRHKEGHWLWVASRAMVVERDAQGEPLRIVGTHLDITERKRVAAELEQAAETVRRSEEQLRQVTDHMPALVSRLDTAQRFCFANRAYRDWLHIEPDSLIGRTLAEVYGKRVLDGFKHHVEAALAGTRVVYDRELATPGGTRWVETTLVPQRNSQGRVEGFYALMIDITSRCEAERERARSEERLSLALESSGLALFDWHIATDRLFHSAQAAAMRGEPPAESTTSAAEMQAHVHPDDLIAMRAQLTQALKGLTPTYDAEFRLRTRTGWLWTRAHGRIVERDATGRAVRLAGTYADINDRKLNEDRLRQLAEYDALTGLPNRALFHDRLRQAMLRAARDKPMALMFLDIDHFKAVNDTWGHETGDQLLQAFAERMRAAGRQSDTVARLAGDEFTIILERLNDLADAKMLAQKLVEALSEPIVLGERVVYASASVGLAYYTGSGCDPEALLRHADEALYEAKRHGRNGYAWVHPPGTSGPRAMPGDAPHVLN